MAFPTKITFFQLNDQYLELDGLADGITGAFVNGATVTASLYDPTGAAVSTFTGIPLNYVAASSGVYRGQVPNTFDPLALGGGYVLKIDAVNGAVKAHIEVSTIVAIRKS